MDLPFLRPSVPSLSKLIGELEAIEARGVFTNFGPVNTALEGCFDTHFGTRGCALTVCNATIGLILSLKLQAQKRPGATLALMPSFTFAATAQAAIWAGLTPLFCDIDPETWLPDAADEQRMIALHGRDIAVMLPCATFGAGLDLDRYEALSNATGIPVVVDAAGGLGTRDQSGKPFGADRSFPVVFSMHATKTFGIGEGGLIHCGDQAMISTLRVMSNFGFETGRSASMSGLNAKLSEVMALVGLAKFDELENSACRRSAIARDYEQLLPSWRFQHSRMSRRAYSFMPVLPPLDCPLDGPAIVDALAADGIAAGRYFSPHCAQQPMFAPAVAQFAGSTLLPVSDAVSDSVVCLPLWDAMTEADVGRIAARLASLVPCRKAVAA